MSPSQLIQLLIQKQRPCPLDEQSWALEFDSAAPEDKQLIANAWLKYLNEDAEEDPNRFIPEYLNQHCVFIQKIYPFINKSLTKDYAFKGTGYSALRYFKSDVSFDMKERLFNLVDQLWHGEDEVKKAALLKIETYIENDFNYQGSTPNWGALVALLAWQVVDKLRLEGEYLQAAIRLSQDAGLEPIYQQDKRDPRLHAWMFITYHIYPKNQRATNAKSLRPDELEKLRQTVTLTIAAMPLSEAASAFKDILSWSETAIDRVTMQHPIKETSILRVLFPEDATLNHVLSRWLPQARSAWDFAAAVGLNFQEAVAFAKESPTVEVTPVAPPKDLVL